MSKDILIEAMVKFNDGEAYVIDRDPQYKYYRQGNLIIGLDDTCTFVNTYYYETPSPGFYAFGGREFDIVLEDGEVINCYGQWWSGGEQRAAELLGDELVSVTYRTIDSLKRCYVFTGHSAIKSALEQLRKTYTGEVMGYREYEIILREKKVLANA